MGEILVFHGWVSAQRFLFFNEVGIIGMKFLDYIPFMCFFISSPRQVYWTGSFYQQRKWNVSAREQN